VLAAYTPQYLRFVWTTSAAVCATAYCLWAFEVATDNETPWPALSVAPFVIAMLRYALDVDQGRAQEPERIVLSDRTLQGLAVVWVVTFAIGAVHA
jgi:decaprenyl-phosphate phosphoribosyltransferase